MTVTYLFDDDVDTTKLHWISYDYLDVNNTIQIVPSDRDDHDIGNCWCEPERQIESGSVIVIHRVIQ